MAKQKQAEVLFYLFNVEIIIFLEKGASFVKY